MTWAKVLQYCILAVVYGFLALVGVSALLSSLKVFVQDMIDFYFRSYFRQKEAFIKDMAGEQLNEVLKREAFDGRLVH